MGTNRNLLVRVLRHPAFLAGDTDTAFFQRHGLGALAEPLADQAAARLSALAAALADAARQAATARVRVPSGWRNLASQPQRESYRAGDDTYQVEYRLTSDGLVAAGNVQLIDSTADRVVLAVDGVRRTFEVAAYDGLVCVDSSLGSVALTPVERFTDPTRLPADGGWRGRPGHHIRSTRVPTRRSRRGEAPM